MTDKNFKHWIWAMVILACVVTICITIDDIAKHPYTIRFEIDNNTLEAVKSVNWSIMGEKMNENPNRCFVNDIEIPCSDFKGDEHFCKDGICRMNGVCGGSYESNLECIKNLTRKI